MDEKDTFVDYYKVLECERDVSGEELKKSYQRLALLLHPDKRKCNKENNFLLLHEAWSTLRVPESRKHYDAKLSCYESDQLLLYDTIFLSDMFYVSKESVYTYQCRCGGLYYLAASELTTSQVNVNCDECSFSIQVNIPL